LKKALFFVFLLILFSVQVSAIKIRYGDFDRVIYFEPNLHKELTFTISDAEKVAKVPLELKGKFAKYAVVEPSELSLRPGERKDIKLTLDLPAEIPEGVHILEISAVEQPAVAQQGAFILMPAVGVALKIINTDNKQSCSLASFNAGITSRVVNIILNAANNGVDKIKGAYADLTLYDSEGVPVTSFQTKSFSIQPFESFTVRRSEKLNNAVEGYYEIKGKLHCAGQEFPVEKKILNHAKDLTIHDFRAYKKGGFLFVEFDTKNEFLAPIKASGVFGFYDGKKSVRNYALANGEVPPMGKKLFQFKKKLSWLEVPAGAYTIKGSLAFEGTNKNAETSIVLTEEELKRADDAAGGGFSVKEREKQKKQEIALEQPSSFSFDGKMFVRVLAALIIIALLIIIYRKYFKR